MAEEKTTTEPTSGNFLVRGAAKVAKAEMKGALAGSKAATKVAKHLSQGIAKVVQKRNKEFNKIMDTQLSKEGLSDEEWQKLYKRFKQRRGAYVYLNKKERMDFERETLKEAEEYKKTEADKEEIAEIVTNDENEIKAEDFNSDVIEDIVTGEIEPIKDDQGRVGYALNNAELEEFVVTDEKTGNQSLKSYKGAWEDERFTVSEDGKYKTDKWGHKYTNDKAGYQEFVRASKLDWIRKARKDGNKVLHINSQTGEREYITPDEAEALLNDPKKFVTMDEIKDHVKGKAKDNNATNALSTTISSDAEMARNLKEGDSIEYDRVAAKNKYSKIVDNTDPYKLAEKKMYGNTSWKQDLTEKLINMKYKELGIDDATVKQLDPTDDGQISESDAKSIVNKIMEDKEMLKGYLTDYFTIYGEREFKANIPSKLKQNQTPNQAEVSKIMNNPNSSNEEKVMEYENLLTGGVVEVQGGTIDDNGEWTPN